MANIAGDFYAAIIDVVSSIIKLLLLFIAVGIPTAMFLGLFSEKQ